MQERFVRAGFIYQGIIWQFLLSVCTLCRPARPANLFLSSYPPYLCSPLQADKFTSCLTFRQLLFYLST